MIPYLIAATGDTPAIELNAEKGIFRLEGKSLPQNAQEFFEPAMTWLKKYSEEPNHETKVICKLEYFNTASSKKIFEFLEECKSITGRVSVEWHYLEDDEDMLEVGQEYARLLNIPFSFFMDQEF